MRSDLCHLLTAARRVGYTLLLYMHHLEQALFGRSQKTVPALIRTADSAEVETPGSEVVDRRD